jgi:NADH dehydrogenase subunit N (EC 1.6.5.3)
MSLSQANWIALLPILILSATIVIVMLSVAVRRNHHLNATLSIVGLNLALIACIPAWLVGAQSVTPLLQIDHFAVFYTGLILASSLAVATLSHAYLESFSGNKEEMYLLLLLSTLGAVSLVCAQHFISFFISLELMSVPLYGMIAYTYHERRGLEGGMKYLVLSAVASAFILFGMALIYARLGGMGFSLMMPLVAHLGHVHDVLLITGTGLLMTGVAFKISAAPFHLWTPDVYEGAPAPVAAYLATVSKIAIFVVLLRFFVESGAWHSAAMVNILTGLALLSIIVGNVLALLQDNLKRLIAYSSIAHFGYLLIAMVATGPMAVEAVGIYLLTYAVTALAAFGVISLMSSPLNDKDADHLWDYRGLFWRRPFLTAILTVALLSLAGIPLTAGFIGKFYIAIAGVDAHLWLLMGALVVGSAVGLFFYLRAMIQLYLRGPWVRKFSAPMDWAARAGGVALLAMTALMLALGIYPQPAIRLIRAAQLPLPPAAFARESELSPAAHQAAATAAPAAPAHTTRVALESSAAS